MKATRTCSHPGCPRRHDARGLCSAHYAQWRRANPGAVGRLAPEARFWAKVEVGDCWEWTAALNEGGYGKFGVNYRMVQAHRWAWELLVGPIPEGHEIDHLCKNRRCVNPDHLEPVAPRVNTLRSAAMSAMYSRRAACSRGHAYTPDNIGSYGARTGRRCKACNREDAAARRAKVAT